MRPSLRIPATTYDYVPRSRCKFSPYSQVNDAILKYFFFLIVFVCLAVVENFRKCATAKHSSVKERGRNRGRGAFARRLFITCSLSTGLDLINAYIASTYKSQGNQLHASGTIRFLLLSTNNGNKRRDRNNHNNYAIPEPPDPHRLFSET